MNPVTELETARIDELLGAFRDLQGQFDMVRERLRRAEEHRNTVPRRIYDRVRSDYDRELDAIRAKLSPLRDELDRVHETLEALVEEALAATHALEEELAEAEFRHRIGEFHPGAFDEMRGALDARASEARTRQANLQSALDAIAATRNTGVPVTGQAAPQELEEAPAPDPAPEHDDAAAADLTTPAATTTLDMYSTDEDFSSLIVDEPPSLQRTYEMSSPVASATPVHEPIDEPLEEDNLADESSAVEEARVEPVIAPVAPSPHMDSLEDPQVVAAPPSPRHENFENPHAWVSEMGADKSRPERRVRLSAPSAPRPVPPPAPPRDEFDTALASLEPPVTTAAPAPAAPPQASLPSLVFVSGPHTGQAIALLPTTLTIGREHDNNVEIKDPDVARYHARILRERDTFVVEDLNSSTGTWVNGERKNRAVLSHGDVVRVGQTELALDYEWTTDSR